MIYFCHNLFPEIHFCVSIHLYKIKLKCRVFKYSLFIKNELAIITIDCITFNRYFLVKLFNILIVVI